MGQEKFNEYGNGRVPSVLPMGRDKADFEQMSVNRITRFRCEDACTRGLLRGHRAGKKGGLVGISICRVNVYHIVSDVLLHFCLSCGMGDAASCSYRWR